MSIRIKNSSSPTDDGRWDWAVWLEADDESDLAGIADVAWHLHPTFPEPIRWSSDLNSGFRIEANGWGTFEIGAVLYNEKGQSSNPYKHQLSFDANDEPEAVESIFVSHTLADSALAAELRKQLEGAGYSVRTADDVVSPGDDWSVSLKSAVQAADAMVVIGKEHTRWQQSEVETAEAAGTRVFEVKNSKLFSAEALEGSVSDEVADLVLGIKDLLEG